MKTSHIYIGSANMKKPHVHAELIKQWADGAEIEWFCDGSWEVLRIPSWMEGQQYRVKPQPHKWQKEIDAWKAGKVVQWKRSTDKYWNGGIHCSADVSTFDSYGYDFRIKPEPVERFYHAYGESFTVHMNQDKTRPHANLKLTFEEGKLVAAEVL
jgi:hypothetical protein